MEEIGVFVRVYNVRPYLEHCISSVLAQTYSNFIFYIVDNGCTDGSSELLERYAEADPRIRLTRYEKNNPDTYVFYKLIQESDHLYLAVLDSDDWWEPDYLERLLSFMKSNNLDIAMTGTVNYYEASHSDKVGRKLDQPIFMSQKQFAEQYPIYWSFPSTYWGSIFKGPLYKKVNLEIICPKIPGYGQDTGVMLCYLEHCKRIGIDNSALYHYRIRTSSISYTYIPGRFDANVGYITVIRGFLEQNHAFTPKKYDWLRRVYLSSLLATVEILKNAQIPVSDKLWECNRIMRHPLTTDALAYPSQENKGLRSLVWDVVQIASRDVQNILFEDIKQLIVVIAPSCAPAVSEEIFPLFLQENSLLNILLRDGRDELAKMLLSFITEGRYVKQYDLGAALQSLAGKESLLSQISDTGFIRKYQDIYWKIWIGQLESALDMMTGLLLKNEVKSEREIFLQLYLSVAAIQSEISAFLFGKIKLAELFLQKQWYEECRTVLSDLEDMGLTNHEEVSAIRDKLKQEEIP